MTAFVFTLVTVAQALALTFAQALALTFAGNTALRKDHQDYDYPIVIAVMPSYTDTNYVQKLTWITKFGIIFFLLAAIAHLDSIVL